MSDSDRPPAPVPPRPVLSVRDLAVSFAGGEGRAVDGVSLTLHAGQALAVVGESGSGKSVTALAIMGLLPEGSARVERGRVLLCPPRTGREEDLLSLDRRERRRVRGGEIGMIFQEPMTSLNPVLSVGEQVAEAVRVHRAIGSREARAIAGEALSRVGIAEPGRRMCQYPHQFSGGMRQRVMIAAAIACRPAVLIADEPTTALDVTIQAQVLALLGGLRRERGMGLMLITHDLGVVSGHADVVGVMYAGRVVEYCRTAELFARPLHPYTRALLACVPRGDTRGRRLATVKEVMGRETELPGCPGLVPWWPAPGPTADYALCAVRADHWVGVRGGGPGGVPDLPPRP